MWEIFTCGKMPYGRLKNTEVVDRVQRGIILEKPKMCFKEVYEVNIIYLIFNFSCKIIFAAIIIELYWYDFKVLLYFS